MKTRIVCTVFAVASLVVVAACSGPDKGAAETKTKAQRDSAIATSGLPGASGVAGALGAADSARARQAAIDSASRP